MRFVQIDVLQPGMVVGRDIYNITQSSMLRRGVTLTEKYIEYLKEKGYIGAYISDVFSEDIDIEETIEQSTFQAGAVAVKENNVDAIAGVAVDIVSQMSQASRISVDLLDLRAYDDYTYHHSVNVAVYAVAVGKRMGLSDEKLTLLAQAGVCHDLGKSRIPEEILNKPSRLTDEEYRVIKEHPKYSYDILSQNNDVPAIVKQAVFFHHENENGTGYPKGKIGQEIPLFAKIIHAVDVYDALTSKRPYKNPHSPTEALEYMKGGKGILFDENVVDIMFSVIPAYPPGIDVYLSNGQTALVVGHTKEALRPRIKLLDTGKIINLLTDDAYKDVVITGSSIMPSDYADEVELLNEDRQPAIETKKKILIVDDDFMSVMLLKRILGTKYDLAFAGNGAEAINYMVNQKTPDLILMDIEMPIMNGIKATRIIREKGFVDIPIIFLSAVNDRQIVMQCKEVGATEYILKPIQPIYLKERIRQRLANERDF